MTKNPSELLSKIDAINVSPYWDTPEMALSALKDALPHAVSNSLAFVFTDAPPSNLGLYDDVLRLVQKKQVQVSFLLTGGTTSSGYDAYRKISQASEGQIFDMARGNVKDVLVKISETLDTKFTALESKNFDRAGKSATKLNVDESISKLTISVSGTNSQLAVKNHKNEMVKGTAFSLNNIKFLTFKKEDSSYTIEASSDSAYSIRAGGISDLKFEFGFSLNFPSELAETSVQPLIGQQNVLSIFVSDPSFVKCLTKATLLPVSSFDSFDNIEIAIERVKYDVFSTNAIDIPTKMFKIRINGYDKNGNVIERLISSGIESTKGCKRDQLNYFIDFH